jgi:predicted HTH transcriptional regulator
VGGVTSPVLHPREVSQDPAGHWKFLTLVDDNKFEGQHFDRKEVCRSNRHGTVSDADLSRFRREHVAESISAFANVNPAGGLLVLGVGSGGEVRGLSHLRESQRNALAVIDDLLVNQACEVKFFDCKNCDGAADTIALVYVPCATSGICETVGRSPRAWKRQGAQNLPLSDADRDRLKRDKGLVDFERTVCAAYDARDVDQGVLKEFRESYLAASTYEKSDEDLLFQIGALARSEQGYSFTNAGALFFAANPQRVMAATYVRLLRFDVPIASRDNRPLPTAEKVFTGPLTKQIRDFRNFLKESAFFKTYQRRNADGGFSDEPEFPFNAVDEAIVNAVAHRDYAVKLPIQCEKYIDALLVRSPERSFSRTRFLRLLRLRTHGSSICRAMRP